MERLFSPAHALSFVVLALAAVPLAAAERMPAGKTSANGPGQVTIQPARPPGAQRLPPPDQSPDKSVGELQPGVGEVFQPPPPIPRLPLGMQALEQTDPVVRERPAFSLQEIEQLACANNPTLIQSRAQVQATLGAAIQAGLWPNPTAFYKHEQIGVANTPGEFVGGTIRQEIPTAHRLQISRAKWLARTQVSEWIAVAQQWQVLNDVRMHFFHTVGQQEIVELQKELLKNAEDALVTTREEYNVGQARRSDVHLANVALQRQRMNLLLEENKLRTSWQMLTTAASVDLPFGPVAGSLEEYFTPIQWYEALNRLMLESPQMQQARVKLVGDQMQLQRELIQSVPNIFVEAGAGRNFEIMPQQTTGFAQVFMDIPIWDRNQGTIRQAHSDLSRQQAEIRRTEVLLRQQLAQVYEKYLTALQHAENFRNVVLPETRRAYEGLLDSYEDDRVRWADVLVVENLYFTERVNYVTTLMTLRESEVLIVGYLLHGALTPPGPPAPPNHIDVLPRPR